MSAATMLVAIIRGGFAGAILANALTGLPHLDTHVFESAPEFSERGTAVGLSGNARVALQHIIPSAKELLARAGAVPINSTRIVLGSGPDAGTLIADLDAHATPEDKELIVHRASLLRELLAPLPKECLHSNKKLTDIKGTGNGIQLTFQDGTTDQFDIVIGADGIFSSVRKYVLQEAAEECAASPAGWWDSRVVVPLEKARTALGEQFFDVHRQYLWTGDKAFLLHDVLENGTLVQCIISAVEEGPPADRKRTLTRELLTATLGDWLEGPIAKGMIELTLEDSGTQGYSQWEHKSTPTYANGRVCIMGRRSPWTTPWQSAGAGQAFEDAAVLGALLSAVSSAEDVNAAFAAYDSVRRPRCQRVIDSSRETGQIFTGRHEEVGITPDDLRAALGGRWAFLTIDLDVHKREALDKMREILGKGK
ncbi:Uu.00g028290.m01.CDS01 [Anthostomella pinea]|uniref:Uu.00g028290.m01.CDS01 n=1 Tax=Anthostomella pinea TaxID=933095 RepID=A0AAI8V8W9_9PEZI|nr:Uu.00g028290.m01.CDS01 [Anthostomella pinea]